MKTLTAPTIARAEAANALARFTPVPPRLHFERILRIQGYSDLTRVRPVIRRTAESMAAIAERLSAPEVVFRHVRVASVGEVLELQGGARLHCRAFARQLRGCSEVVPFALTVGQAIPQRVIDLAEAGDLLEGLLLETAGWLAIEDATRQFKGWLREAMIARGLRITSRMGPGYSYKIDGRMHDWPLEEQRTLFSLFGEAELPVKLMASCAMLPKMSRSGLYGIAPATPSP
ncbi:MAG TPA: hypothetical protein VEC19_19875 [Usitatibacter sp.]|nr:hypothetical protein [Usitatibacter sp.]